VEKLGLVVYPHGGPHSVWTDQFQRCIWFFNQLNLAVLLVNYCGSPGFGEAALKSQPGKKKQKTVSVRVSIVFME